jgi:hypothetical protein
LRSKVHVAQRTHVAEKLFFGVRSERNFVQQEPFIDDRQVDSAKKQSEPLVMLMMASAPARGVSAQSRVSRIFFNPTCLGVFQQHAPMPLKNSPNGSSAAFTPRVFHQNGSTLLKKPFQSTRPSKIKANLADLDTLQSLYLSRELAAEKNEERRVELIEAIRHGSAATWKHFNLHGEFDFSDERMVDSMGLAALPKNQAFEQG